MLEQEKVSKLAQALRGELISPGDANYDHVRALYNGMIDKRPRLIARCADVADVIAAVRFGRDNDLVIAIRGGGHNGAGLGSCDDGLVIDLSRLKGVRIDPGARRVTSITQRTRLAWRCRRASCRPPASPGSPWAEGTAT